MSTQAQYGRSLLVTVLIVGISTVPTLRAQESDEAARAHREQVQQSNQAMLETQWGPISRSELEHRRRITELLQSSRQDIDGNQTPELVPYHIRMQHFFHGYAEGIFQRMLGTQLSAADHAILREFAPRLPSELAKQAAMYDAEWMSIAARAASMDAREIAGAINAATLRAEAAQAALYRSIIDRLSARGRLAVNDFAFAVVRPQLSIEDPFVVANAEPEFFKDQIIKTYEMIRRGEQPPPLAKPAGKTGVGITDSSPTDQLGSNPFPP